ncbi:hypothetical protein AB0F17_56545, partial [Nonomuraea sp. NPDC026600]|uniref:hypothetical protein n=1 Tax=Nonomuraea sp. NPDC026600 TaxID=3155363 RepID=UPI0033D93A34
MFIGGRRAAARHLVGGFRDHGGCSGRWAAGCARRAGRRGPGPASREDAGLHGDAVGVEIGDLRPRFAELEEHLLHH